jgi:alcohol dehydrogenase
MTGRAAVFHGVGRPLELTEVAPPAPASGELLVRVSCCTLCRSDLHTHAGRRTEPTPIILGHEIVGTIEAFGPETQPVDAAGADARVGDRITWSIVASCGRWFFCRADLPQKCEHAYKYGHQRLDADHPAAGGLAEYVLLAPGTNWLRVPAGVSDHVASMANCATATVAGLLSDVDVAGSAVVVFGAGVLGLTACAMARSAGASYVAAVDPHPECAQRAREFGATHALADAEAARSALAGLTSGRGADLVLELSGAVEAVIAGIDLLRIGGTLLLAGTVSPTASAPLQPETIVRRMLTIRGVHNYRPRDLAAALEFLAAGARQFPFDSLVQAEFPLDRVNEAFAHAHATPGIRTAIRP